MQTNNTSQSSKTITLAIFSMWLVVPFGKVLVPHTEEILTFTSNLFLALIALFSPLLLIPFLTKSGREYLRKWWRLILFFTVFSGMIYISNNVKGLSSVANLGYIHMSLADIIIRIITMALCYYLTSKYIDFGYKNNDLLFSKKIIATFGTTQIILFLTLSLINLIAVM